ncbi:ornithine cyclodeaminase family protein [Acidisoma sp. C75]
MSLRLFDAAAVREHAPIRAVIEAVRDALIRHQQGEFDCPQRLSFDQSFGLVMPVYHRQSRTLAIKSLTLDPARVPLIKGTVSLVAGGAEDPVIADAPMVTALRTAALFGLATDLFAPPDASRAVIFGTGAQGLEQARALVAVRPITALTLVSRSHETALAAAERLRGEMPQLRILAAREPEAALREADIVGCATTARAPLFAAEAIKPGAFIGAIGSYRPDMHELPQELLAAAGRIYVDDVEACLVESGEIITALAAGRIGREQLIPLGEVARDAGETPPPRAASGAPRIFKSVGVAPLDWAVMRVLAAAA